MVDWLEVGVLFKGGILRAPTIAETMYCFTMSLVCLLQQPEVFDLSRSGLFTKLKLPPTIGVVLECADRNEKSGGGGASIHPGNTYNKSSICVNNRIIYEVYSLIDHDDLFFVS